MRGCVDIFGEEVGPDMNPGWTGFEYRYQIRSGDFVLSGASRQRISLVEMRIFYTWGMGSDNLNIDVVFDLVTFWSLFRRIEDRRGHELLP